MYAYRKRMIEHFKNFICFPKIIRLEAGGKPSTCFPPGRLVELLKLRRAFCIFILAPHPSLLSARWCFEYIYFSDICIHENPNISYVIVFLYLYIYIYIYVRMCEHVCVGKEWEIYMYIYVF